MKKLQLIFADKYSIIHRIGMSPHSEVYLAFQADSQLQYAIKLENADSDVKQLQRQAKIYRIIKGGVGIPNLYWYGVENQYRALVTDILGPSLQQLLKYCEGKFSLKTTLLIADQIVDRLEWVHSKNLVYGDLDTQNLLVGLKEKADKIFLVDFGSCRKFVDNQSNHISFANQNNSYLTNIRFKSIHGHIGKLQSRRDDLQSLGYLLVYMLKGKLPWDKVQAQDDIKQNLQVKQKKVSIPVDILCQGLQPEFLKYFGYVQSLQFQEEPDYVWIKRLFKDLFDRSGYENNRVLDWAQKHK